MADWYTLALTFSPTADVGLLTHLKNRLRDTDDDFPHVGVGAAGVVKSLDYDQIEGAPTWSWRSPSVKRADLVELLEASGLSGYGLFFWDRRPNSTEPPTYSADDCFAFGGYGCAPDDWRAVVSALASARGVGPLLETRLRVVLPILASVAARSGVTVAGLPNRKLAEYRGLLEALRAGEYETDRYGICARCGTWAPHGHPEAHDHRATCEEQVVAARAACNTVGESAIAILADLVSLAKGQAPKWRHGDPPVNAYVYREGFSETYGEPVFVDRQGYWWGRAGTDGPMAYAGKWGDAAWAPLGGLPS